MKLRGNRKISHYVSKVMNDLDIYKYEIRYKNGWTTPINLSLTIKMNMLAFIVVICNGNFHAHYQ